MTKRALSREQFIAAFAEGYGVTVAQLLEEQDCVACDCGEDLCAGWRMVPKPQFRSAPPKPVTDFTFTITDSAIVPHDDVPPLLDQIRKQFVETAVKTRGEMALRMILHGQFPSQGWTIGERTEVRDGQMYYECFPIPPKK